MRLSEIIASAILVAGGAAAFRRVRAHERQVRRQELVAGAEGQPRHRVVIVGAGFAGLAAANHLHALVGDDPRFDVLMVDRHNYHLFYPLLYQVSTGGIEPGTLAFPARVIARQQGFRFLEANVENVDLEAKRLDTDAGPIPYDHLILGPGSVSNFFGMKDAAEHALPLKSLKDGLRIRNRIIETFELADQEADPEQRRALLSYVVVGGGATGVELTSSLRDMIFTSLLPNYPRIRPDELRLAMVESHHTVLKGWTPAVQRLAMNTLRERGVELVMGTTVVKVTDEGIETKDGQRIPTATVVWTAGVKAPPVIEHLPGQRERDGRIHVDSHLRLPDHPDVSIVGDAAFYVNPVDGKPVPPTAEAALSQGHAAAEFLVRQERGEELEPYRFYSKGELVSLGRGAAAANIFGIVFSGLAAWFLRRAVYLENLVGFRNRLLVVIDWGFVSFHRRVIASYDNILAARREIPLALGSGTARDGSSSVTSTSESASSAAPRPAGTGTEMAGVTSPNESGASTPRLESAPEPSSALATSSGSPNSPNAETEAEHQTSSTSPPSRPVRRAKGKGRYAA